MHAHIVSSKPIQEARKGVPVHGMWLESCMTGLHHLCMTLMHDMHGMHEWFWPVALLASPSWLDSGVVPGAFFTFGGGGAGGHHAWGTVVGLGGGGTILLAAGRFGTTFTVGGTNLWGGGGHGQYLPVGRVTGRKAGITPGFLGAIGAWLNLWATSGSGGTGSGGIGTAGFCRISRHISHISSNSFWLSTA